MAITVNDNFKVNAGKPVDVKYLNSSNQPYLNEAEVLSEIPVSERSLGLTVNIQSVEYWFKDDVNTLVIKSSDSSLSNGNGTEYDPINNSVDLGNTLTKPT